MLREFATSALTIGSTMLEYGRKDGCGGVLILHRSVRMSFTLTYKCVFSHIDLLLLGCIVDGNGVRHDLEKIKGVIY